MTQTYENRRFDSVAEVYRFLSQLLQSQLHKALKMGKHFSVALSGGNTPREFLHFAARVIEKDLLSNAAFFQVDERFVPPLHPESNRNMIEQAFVQTAGISKWFPINTECANPLTASASYNRVLATSPYLNRDEAGRPVFDLILLGIGSDGHTASLFPGTSAESISDKYAICVSPSGKSERISLSYQVLIAASCLIFLVTGKDKREIMNELFHTSNPMPARSVIEHSHRSIIVYDADADPMNTSNCKEGNL